MIGKILGGRYEIIEEIGKGGMAHVYKAKCILLNRIVAIKILREDLDGDEEFLNRFKSEARAAASLTHSNIVAIFDVGIDEGINYIVMEYVDGITLKEYITQNGQLDFEEVFEIAYQICDAMQAAHEKNIVHRDIKPHNILITEDKKIKVTDFGIARFGTGNTLTTNDDILGSVHYISPEQAKGETVDNRSDIYSLGVAMYEMLTGNVPFDADTPVAVAMMQIEDTPKINVDLEYDVPLGAWQIVFKSLSKDPDLRYQNASDFKTDIQSLLQNHDFFLPDGELYFDDDVEYDDEKIVYDENPEQPTKLTKAGMVILGALTAIFILIVTLFFSLGGFQKFVMGESVSQDIKKVPKLIGMSYVEAENYCKKHNITLVYKDEKVDDKYEPGVIISQNPREGSEAENIDVIEVTVNKASQTMVLDDYTGKNYEDVEEELTEKGFTVKIHTEISSTPKDTILRQSPEQGVKVSKDTVITLYISIGNSNTYKLVPDLVGLTYEQACAKLKSLDFEVGSINGVESPNNDDVVIDQSIPNDLKALSGTRIGLTLQSKNNNDDNIESDDNNDLQDDSDENEHEFNEEDSAENE